jgi:drug/metabolite transporter (DMT)-like permease
MSGLPQTLKVHGALVAISAIYGIFYIIVKLLLQDIREYELILARLSLAALIAFTIELIRYRTRFQSLSDFLKVISLGLLGVLIVQSLVVLGVSRTSVFHASLLMSTIPVQTLMFGMLVGREPFQFHKFIGILTAFLGVGWLVFMRNPGTTLPPGYLIGDLFVLLNALSFSWFLIASKPILERYPAFSFMAYCYLVSALVALALLGSIRLQAPTALPISGLFHLTLRDWALLLYVVVLASIGTYTLNNYALKRTAPSTVAVYIFVQPILSAILGYYLLGEGFTVPMALAGLLTFTGIVLATRSAL